MYLRACISFSRSVCFLFFLFSLPSPSPCLPVCIPTSSFLFRRGRSVFLILFSLLCLLEIFFFFRVRQVSLHRDTFPPTRRHLLSWRKCCTHTEIFSRDPLKISLLSSVSSDSLFLFLSSTPSLLLPLFFFLERNLLVASSPCYDSLEAFLKRPARLLQPRVCRSCIRRQTYADR